MAERKEFCMTEEQHRVLLDACKPVTYIVVGGIPPRSPQQNANDAWERLGKELGFNHMTARPSPKGERYFTAEVCDVAD